MRRLLPLASVLAGLAACSDYNLSGGKDANPDPEPGAPDLVASPAAVSAEGACPDAREDITLRNDGDADLDILAVGTTGDWVIDGLSMPLTLGPGDEEGFWVEGSGAGTLQIESTDPAEPLVTIPLDAAPDTAPEIAILAPSTNDILEPGDRLLEAQVSDLEDPSAHLIVTWASDVDGVLGSGAATSAGESWVTWPSPRTEGDHLLTASVVDSCGNTASAQTSVCQQAGYTVDELDLSSWQFEGVANWDASNNWLELTSAGQGLVGTAFATDTVVDASNVEIRFSFYIGDGTGADGISLTALDVDRMTTFLGGTGCGIGYGGGASCTVGPALPGWSIEIDTYDNGSGVEPTPNDHLAFTFDGDVDAYVAWAELPEMEDTGWHEMSVVVAAPRVTIAIDGTTYIDQDLGGSFGFDAYVGFTAGTGGETNRHLIDALTVTETVCEE